MTRHRDDAEPVPAPIRRRDALDAQRDVAFSTDRIRQDHLPGILGNALMDAKPTFAYRTVRT